MAGKSQVVINNVDDESQLSVSVCHRAKTQGLGHLKGNLFLVNNDHMEKLKEMVSPTFFFFFKSTYCKKRFD